jgi:hypothetical protein
MGRTEANVVDQGEAVARSTVNLHEVPGSHSLSQLQRRSGDFRSGGTATASPSSQLSNKEPCRSDQDARPAPRDGADRAN